MAGSASNALGLPTDLTATVLALGEELLRTAGAAGSSNMAMSLACFEAGWALVGPSIRVIQFFFRFCPSLFFSFSNLNVFLAAFGDLASLAVMGSAGFEAYCPRVLALWTPVFDRPALPDARDINEWHLLLQVFFSPHFFWGTLTFPCMFTITIMFLFFSFSFSFYFSSLFPGATWRLDGARGLFGRLHRAGYARLPSNGGQTSR